MTRVEAATKLVELYALCETHMRDVSRVLPSEYVEAAAVACTAIRGEKYI